MNIRQMEIFISVVRYGNFSNAAKKIFLSQPAISSCIDALEKELDTKLFVRQGRAVMLTEKGEFFYQGALTILGLTEKTIQKVMDTQTIEGTIRICADYVPGTFYIPQIIQEFHRIHPGIRFDVSIAGSSKVVKNVLEGYYDIGLIGAPVNNDFLKQKCILTDRMMIMAANELPFSRLPSPLSLDILKELPFISRMLGASSPTIAELALAKLGISFSELNVIAEMDNGEAVLESVLNGMGVAILSSMCARRHPELLKFEIENIDMWRNFYGIQANSEYVPPRISLFYDYLKEVQPSEKNELGELNQ